MYFFDGFEKGFFEFGIYLIIVILAAVLVFYIIWYLNRRLNGKTSEVASKSVVKGKLSGNSKEAPLLLEDGKARKADKHDKKNKNEELFRN